MKNLIAVFLASICFTGLLSARTFVSEEVGVSLVLPDDWVRGRKGELGILILPHNGANEKIRIHPTIYRKVAVEQALLDSVVKVNAMRKQEGQPLEKIFGSTPIVTKSGISGQKAGIGPDQENARPYVNRYYFLKPDGSIFCVGVYFYGDEAFEKLCEKAIVDTLNFSVP